MDIVIRSNLKKSIGVSNQVILSLVLFCLKQIKIKSVGLSINFVGEKKIRTLNKKYRHQDRVTDVLSFATDDIIKTTYKILDLGDIFICPGKIKSQAKAFSTTYKNELSRMIIHGILHLAGYDHIRPTEEKIMFDLQEKILYKFYESSQTDTKL